MYFAAPFDALGKSPLSRLSGCYSLVSPTMFLQVVSVFLLAFLRGGHYAGLRGPGATSVGVVIVFCANFRAIVSFLLAVSASAPASIASNKLHRHAQPGHLRTSDPHSTIGY